MKNVLIFCLGAILFGCTENTISTSDNFEEVVLPDESIVKLNKNSRLSYEASFSERKVKLKGEAFFDVTKGTEPFTVVTDFGNIKVLGTAFNVRSDEEGLEVQVKEGLVEVQNSDFIGQIEDGMKATLKKGEKQFKKAKADLNYDKWVVDLEKEVKALSKEVEKGARELQKESEKLGEEIKKESKRLGEEVKEETNKLKEKIKSAVKE